MHDHSVIEHIDKLCSVTLKSPSEKTPFIFVATNREKTIIIENSTPLEALLLLKYICKHLKLKDPLFEEIENYIEKKIEDYIKQKKSLHLLLTFLRHVV